MSDIAMARKKANGCRCIGRPLRFEPEFCFTCGRMLGQFIGRRERNERATGASDGAWKLLAAVEHTRIKLGKRERLKMDLAKARRVVIEPPPRPKKIEPEPLAELVDDLEVVKVKKHGGRRTKPRSKAVRDLEFATRTF